MLAKLLSDAPLAGIAVIASVVMGTPVVAGVIRLARPEGSEHTPPTIVIDGMEELAEALRAA